MEANLFLLLAAGVLCGSGVYLMLDRAMTKMLLGILLLGNAPTCCSCRPAGRLDRRLSTAARPPNTVRTSRTHWPKA